MTCELYCLLLNNINYKNYNYKNFNKYVFLPHYNHLFIIKQINLFTQTDRKTNGPKIWIYRDKMSGRPKGEATIAYDDTNAAQSAISWFGGTF